jgi:acyl carrier protein
MDEKKLMEIIAEFTTYDAEHITSDMDFVDDLGIDSLDLAQILMSLEDELDIDLDDDISENIKTVGDAIELFNRKVSQS